MSYKVLRQSCNKHQCGRLPKEETQNPQLSSHEWKSKIESYLCSHCDVGYWRNAGTGLWLFVLGSGLFKHLLPLTKRHNTPADRRKYWTVKISLTFIPSPWLHRSYFALTKTSPWKPAVQWCPAKYQLLQRIHTLLAPGPHCVSNIWLKTAGKDPTADNII